MEVFPPTPVFLYGQYVQALLSAEKQTVVTEKGIEVLHFVTIFPLACLKQNSTSDPKIHFF